MTRIDSFNFGFIIINEKQYVQDVVILPDGVVKEREQRKGRLGSHSIGRSEIESLSETRPDVIVIGTGVTGMARLAHDAESYLLHPDLNIMVFPTVQAVKKYNELVDDGEQVAALIHITC
jgi:hypothetical protein